MWRFGLCSLVLVPIYLVTIEYVQSWSLAVLTVAASFESSGAISNLMVFLLV